MADPVLCALFVDFDNIYMSLSRIGREDGAMFRSNPDFVIPILESLGFDDEECVRKFIIRRCYANPYHLPPRQRGTWTKAAFEVIDCPPLAGAQKNSADILMIMDIIDTIEEYSHVKEYFILSADSDFTPVLMRLRKYVKRTFIYANAVAARVYRNSCDEVVEENEFLQLLYYFSNQKVQPAVNSPVPPKRESPPPPSKKSDTGAPNATQEAAQIIKDIVKTSSLPVKFSVVVHELTNKIGQDKKFAGQGSFTKLLKKLSLSGVKVDYDANVLLDEEKISNPSYNVNNQVDQISSNLNIEESFKNTTLMMSNLTGIPKLSPDTYQKIFADISKMIASNEEAVPTSSIAKELQQENQRRGNILDYKGLNFIVRAITRDGHKPQKGDTADELAQRFFLHCMELCLTAGLPLAETEVSTLVRWFGPWTDNEEKRKELMDQTMRAISTEDFL